MNLKYLRGYGLCLKQVSSVQPISKKEMKPSITSLTYGLSDSCHVGNCIPRGEEKETE